MRKLIVHPILLVLILAVSACAPTAPAANSTPAASQAPARLEVLRLAGGDYGYPQPFTRNSRGPGFINMSMIFDTLIWKDASGNFLPWLAEKWTSGPDGLTWSFNLRSGVKWQDGQPFSADDVVFSYRYLSDNPGPSTITVPGLIKDVQKKGDLAVEITLGQAYAPFLRNIAGALPILPKHIWADVKEPQKFTDAKAVIGTGPYKLSSYNKAEGTYLFEANDDFWLGKPYVKRIEMVAVSNSALSLKQGDIDAGDISGYADSANNDIMKTFKEDPKYGLLQDGGEWNLVVYINMAQGAPFNDKNFRQAVAYALDLKTMVSNYLFGDGTTGIPGWAAPVNPWKNPDTQSYPYDPAKAKTLLDQAGLLDKNKDGKRERPDGSPLSIELLTPTSYPRPAEMIKTWLADVGVEITVKTVDQASADQATTQGKYQLALIGHGALGSDPEQLSQIFYSKSKWGSFYQAKGYQNARFDELASKQVQTFDEAARKQMIYEMQKILVEDVPVIPLYYPNRNLIFNKNVLANWYYTPGGIGSGVPTAWNKHLYITGEKTGLKIKGTP